MSTQTNGHGADAAPLTSEQQLASATSAHDMRHGVRTARGHGYEMRGLGYVPASRSYEGRFGRMFRLPPFTPSTERILEVAALMIEADGRDPEGNNPGIPAGFTYLGQFIDHDLTHDTASSLERQNDPDALTNFRSPRFDLDSLYGRGPVDDPFLYSKASNRQKMLIGRHDDEDDLPRTQEDETALIGDPRNDENTFVSQLHLTMLKFHNQVFDSVKDLPELQFSVETPFDRAQQIVRWHYQWVAIHDYLRRTVGEEMLNSVLDTSGPVPRVVRQFYKWKYEPFMPVEFSVAAYRFGHSQIRGGYKLNTFVPGLPTFKPGRIEDDRLGSFGGFRILPPFWTIEWARFFEVEGAGSDNLQLTRKIDTQLADPLKNLPEEIAGNRPSLIDRNLTRGSRLLLPSGQDVARHMGADILTDQDLGLPGGGPAPLWYYILKEAELQAGGLRLGQVGGRIVAEVFLGLMEKDPLSYLHQQPNWTPTLPGKTAGDFTMADLITFTGHGLDAINGPGAVPDGQAQPEPVPTG